MFSLITKPDCPWCDRAKELLEEKGYTYRTFDYNEPFIVLLLLKKAGLKTVPQIWLNNDHIGGYEDLVEWFEEHDT